MSIEGARIEQNLQRSAESAAATGDDPNPLNTPLKSPLKSEVRRVAEALRRSPDRPVRWRLLRGIEDWKELTALHPGWHIVPGGSPILSDPEAQRIYRAFLRWAKRSSGGDPAQYRELVSQLVPLASPNRQPRTLKDWKNIFSEAQSAPGTPTEESRKAARRLVQSFRRWAEKEIEHEPNLSTKIERQMYLRALCQEVRLPASSLPGEVRLTVATLRDRLNVRSSAVVQFLRSLPNPYDAKLPWRISLPLSGSNSVHLYHRTFLDDRVKRKVWVIATDDLETLADSLGASLRGTDASSGGAVSRLLRLAEDE